jgi:hypothetical protein
MEIESTESEVRAPAVEDGSDDIQSRLTHENMEMADLLGVVADAYSKHADGAADASQSMIDAQTKVRDASRAGNRFAKFYLAQAMDDGELGLACDTFAAMDLLEELIEQYQFKAAYGRLAWIYVKRGSHEKGMQLAEAGAKLDDPMSCMVLGVCHEGFEGHRADPLSACRYFKRAIELSKSHSWEDRSESDLDFNFARGQASLKYASHLFSGVGIAENQEGAIALLEGEIENYEIDKRVLYDSLVDYVERSSPSLPQRAERLARWHTAALGYGSDKARSRELNAQRTEEWDQLRNLAVDDVNFLCFTEEAILINKRTERKSTVTGSGGGSSYGSGTIDSVNIQTHHTSWQVLTFRNASNADRVFDIVPDATLAIDTGARYRVVYVGLKGGSTSYPVRVVNDDGHYWDISNDIYRINRLDLPRFAKKSLFPNTLTVVLAFVLSFFATGLNAIAALFLGVAILAGIIIYKVASRIKGNERREQVARWLGKIVTFLANP